MALSPASFSSFTVAEGDRKSIVHVAALAERGLKLLQGKKDFAVVAARIVLRFDIDRADQATVLAAAQVRPGTHVGVVKAEPGGAGYERNSLAAVGRNERGPFLRRAIHIRRNRLPVPMKLLRDIRVVMHVHRNPYTLAKAKQRTGELTVISRHRNDAFGSQFNWLGGNGESVIGLCFGLLIGVGRQRETGAAAQQSAANKRRRGRQKLSARAIDTLHGVHYVASG